MSLPVTLPAVVLNRILSTWFWFWFCFVKLVEIDFCILLLTDYYWYGCIFCDMLPFLIVVVCKWFMEELCAVLLDFFLSCVETQTLLPCMSWSYICHCCSLQFMNMLWVCPMHIFCEVSLLSDWTSCSSVMQKFDSRRNSKQSEVWTCHSWFVFSWAVPL